MPCACMMAGCAHQRVITLDRPHEYIGIDEDRHLPAVWVKILTA